MTELPELPTFIYIVPIVGLGLGIIARSLYMNYKAASMVQSIQDNNATLDKFSEMKTKLVEQADLADTEQKYNLIVAQIEQYDAEAATLSASTHNTWLMLCDRVTEIAYHSWELPLLFVISVGYFSYKLYKKS